MVKIEINLSNRTFYTIIAVAFLLVFGVGVYALGVPETFGHNIYDVSPPGGCADDSIVVIQSGIWGCADAGDMVFPGGGESYWSLTSEGGIIYTETGKWAVKGKNNAVGSGYLGGTLAGVEGYSITSSKSGVRGKNSNNNEGHLGTSSAGVYGKGNLYGVYGNSESGGAGIYGQSSSGFSGFFTGGKGVYIDRILQLKPAVKESYDCSNNIRGSIIYNSGDNRLYVCMLDGNTYKWRGIEYR